MRKGARHARAFGPPRADRLERSRAHTGRERRAAERARAGSRPGAWLQSSRPPAAGLELYTPARSSARWRRPEIIGRELGISPVSERALTELTFGDWEGCSWDEIGRRWPEQFAAYAADRRNYAPPNGESYAEMLGRAWPFVDALRARRAAAALCVCHSAVMRGLLAGSRG